MVAHARCARNAGSARRVLGALGARAAPRHASAKRRASVRARRVLRAELLVAARRARRPRGASGPRAVRAGELWRGVPSRRGAELRLARRGMPSPRSRIIMRVRRCGRSPRHDLGRRPHVRTSEPGDGCGTATILRVVRSVRRVSLFRIAARVRGSKPCMAGAIAASNHRAVRCRQDPRGRDARNSRRMPGRGRVPVDAGREPSAYAFGLSAAGRGSRRGRRAPERASAFPR